MSLLMSCTHKHLKLLSMIRSKLDHLINSNVDEYEKENNKYLVSAPRVVFCSYVRMCLGVFGCLSLNQEVSRCCDDIKMIIYNINTHESSSIHLVTKMPS